VEVSYLLLSVSIIIALPVPFHIKNNARTLTSKSCTNDIVEMHSIHNLCPILGSVVPHSRIEIENHFRVCNNFYIKDILIYIDGFQEEWM
jgi:hypothetical protein